MKKILLVAMFLASFSNALSAQQLSENWVKDSKTIPEFLDQNQDWRHDTSSDEIQVLGKSHIMVAVECYVNDSKGLVAYVWVGNDKNGLRQELFMQYGTANVARAAIKVNGKWHVGKKHFFDHFNHRLEYDINFGLILDAQGIEIGTKVTLDTLDGLKTLDLPL